MERKVLLIGLFLVGAALALFVAEKQQVLAPGAPDAVKDVPTPKAPSAPAIRGKPAPDVELPDLSGAKLRLRDLKDKVLLVNFWATWCAPCELEIPWFIDFDKKYREQGLEIVGISLDEEGPEVVKRFVAKKKMTYKVVMGDDKAAEAFGGVIGLPTTFIVDRNGKFYSMHRGLVGKDIVEEELLELLGTTKEPSSASKATPSTPRS